MSVRELRSDSALNLSGARDPAEAGQHASAPGHSPSAMPADIVARAQAAMRRANNPEPEVAQDHLDLLTSEETANEPAPTSESPDDALVAAPPPAAVTAPPAVAEEHASGPDSSTAPAMGEEPTVPAAATAPATATAADPAAPAGPAPWERQSAPGGEPALLEQPQERAAWRGYNPDYVADQMVPMIHARATTGWRSWLGLQPSRAEQRRKQLQAEMCVNFGQPVKIVLANPRGYAGKTTMAICLAAALGVARGGGVCAFENHELRGVMGLRTVTNGTQRTTRDFINDLSQMTPEQVRHADLSRYVRHQHAGNFDAMVTSRNFEKQLDGAEYRAASALLERFYEVIVIDTANNEAHEAFQAALADATVLVVPTKWRPTHLTPAAQMLNDMAARSPRHRLLVENAVVVATNGATEAVPGAREMAMPMFSSLAHSVIEIPPDPHIEADRPILHDQLRPATRRALDEFGAAVCRVAVTNIHAMEELL